MADLFKTLTDVNAPVNLNHFDLSRRHLLTCKPSMLTPVLAVETVPQDKIEISVASLIRMQPLLSAAYLRCTAYFHFYFVPYSQLWRRWPEFLAQRDDPVSSYEKGYNYVPTFNIADCYKTAKTNIDSTSTDYNDLFNRNMLGDSVRLMSLLGYGGAAVRKGSSSTIVDITNPQDLHCNPFRAAAYQKIWSDYYRNPYYDRIVPVKLFNFDDFDCTSFQASTYSFNRSNDTDYPEPIYLFTPRYRTWKKDLFMSTLPSQQDGAVSSVSLSGVNITNNVSLDQSTVAGIRAGVTTVPALGTSQLMLRNSDNTSVSGSSYWNINNAFSVLQLRQAEALQRWKETTLRAGQRANSQLKAHYGSVGKHIVDERCEYLGGFDMTISVDEVVAQSSFVGSSGGASIGNELGQIAGKGIGVSGRNRLQYNATEFGVLMCIMTILPTAEYDATGVDYGNTLSQPFDFFTKEFQDVSLQPLSRVQLDYQKATTASHINKNLGYVPMYAGYKTAVDKVFGSFMSGESLSYWASSRKDLTTASLNVGSIGLRTMSYYVDPYCLDGLFAINSDNTPDTDQFLCNLHFDVKALRNMSVLGLPQF